MTTLSTPPLAHLLRASAAGWYATEAAGQLLCEHRSLITRADLLAACVEYDHDGTEPVAWVVWDAIPCYVDRAALSSSKARILRLVAELGGADTGVPLDELMSSLDDENAPPGPRRHHPCPASRPRRGPAMNGTPICRHCDDVCLECEGTGECWDCESYGCESCDQTGDCPCCDGGRLVDEEGHRR